MNKEWVETAMRLADEYADQSWHDGNGGELCGNSAATTARQAALEAHLNTTNTDQVNSAKHQSTATACLRELVELKGLKERMEEAVRACAVGAHAMLAEYHRRMPLAWAAARAVIAQTRSDSAEAEKQNLPKRYIAGTPW